ncbi:twin transmembrane helix small protein [Celeribacter ethanolicus]|uniref:Twin transmembrane helix small protein n=1 Tax=Celeribacter ethanolicus TaxID=1758178 RepID=A0A291GFB3_9RHOB|nr:twin transmembrane helix small protein [Celeribacter ethanolicus]ATG48742.1 twin transmembrane helix small protein [Celeribacter ethanolicus]TNE63903.1 MAG: twin transmembrane helix small protein [Paracoccaceae bacterium]
MSDTFLTVIFAACLVVVLILAFGIAQFGRGGVEGAKRSNKLMQARILAQLGAVILVVIYVALRKSGN